MKRIVLVLTVLTLTACAPAPKKASYSEYFDMCAAKMGKAKGAFETCTTFAFNATR